MFVRFCEIPWRAFFMCRPRLNHGGSARTTEKEREKERKSRYFGAAVFFLKLVLGTFTFFFVLVLSCWRDACLGLFVYVVL